MKISILCIGKTSEEYLKTGNQLFLDRLKHYGKVSYTELADVKNAISLSANELKKKEAEQFLKQISNQDFVVLLDEKGKQYTSEAFAKFIENKSLESVSQIVFVIGGAFGFDDSLYSRANMQMALSSMTFTHQMVRLIFVEQIYRALTIIKKHPYHHP